MSPVTLRSATADDVPAIARIGGPAMLAQYDGLVDPRAVQAAVDQLYAPSTIAECIARCSAAPDAEYMLLVAEGNDRAVAFYERHSLHTAQAVDGLSYYSERMGVEFPADTRPFRLILMRAAPRS